jgi:UDP-glucose 4-epimerase
MPIGEGVPRQPINPYGASKFFFENALEAYERAYAVRSVRLRYFNAAGADESDSAGVGCSRWDRSRATGLLERIIPRRTALASETMSTSTTWPRHTSLPCST